jgi:hypothetical protein
MTPARTVEFHPEAIGEARAAREWYADRNPSLGTAFLNELDRAIQQIAEAPDRWMNYKGET